MKKEKVCVILQARMSSTRLPGKVLKPILNQPMLALQLERVKKAKKVDEVIVATSTNAEDDAIDRLCQKLNINCFRGNLYDVLDRYYQAAKKNQAKHIIRLTGDCPLSCPGLIDTILSKHIDTKSEFTSNCEPYTLPSGLDVEIIRFDILEKVWKKASSDHHREHVTAFIREGNDFFKENYNYPKDYTDFRLTVDYFEDLVLVEKIYEHFYASNPDFGFLDIFHFLEKHPEIRKINAMHVDKK